MRSLRTLMIAAGLVGIAPTFALAQAKPSPEFLLRRFQPSLNGVEYEVPTDPNAIAACKIETVYNANKKAIGYTLRDGQGKLLRKFLDSNGNGSLDQWSYYQDGFEVYRESDTNGDKSLDECRWLNGGGTRIAIVKSVEVAPKSWKIQVTGWRRISAEEASKVFVQSLISADLPLMESVLATPEELASLGVPKAVIEKVTASSAKRIDEVKALQRGLKGWNSQTVWSRLDGLMPHLIPRDESANSLVDDLTLYENAVIFAGSPNGQANPAEMAFLQAPEMVKIGDSWKFVELPRAVDPAKPIVTAEGEIRSAIYGGQGSGRPQEGPMENALRDLAKFDEQHAGAVDPKQVAEFHVGRIPLLRAVVKVSKGPEDRLVYNKQIVDSLAAAAQSGFFPKGLNLLEDLVKTDEDPKLRAYAAYRKLFAEMAIRANDPAVNAMANQKKWMADLKEFLEKFAKSDEAAEALLQLAASNEYNAEEDEAKKYYEQAARDFPESDPGKKAVGALRRLDLIGKSFSLKGPGLNNEPIDTAQYRGKTLLVAFWASYAEPFKRDLPELMKVYQKHREQGFEVVGVCLDPERGDLDQFLKANPLPWPEVFVPGGVEKSPMAFDYGIIALPTMILVDGQGKVVNRSIRTAAELEKQLEKVLADNGSGVALGSK